MLDEAQPPPVAARQWQARRIQACARGDSRLAGDDHVVPRYLQVFIDDWGGVALDDEVTPPAYVAGIVISAESTLAAGGAFVGPGTRVHVHAQITIFTLTRAGLEAAGNKTEVGDPVISLGLRVARARWRVDIPEGKRLIMLAELGKLRDAAGSEPPTVDVTMAQRVVGRLGNLSQVMPEILAHIHGGHAIVNGVWAQRAAGRPRRRLVLSDLLAPLAQEPIDRLLHAVDADDMVAATREVTHINARTAQREEHPPRLSIKVQR